MNSQVPETNQIQLMQILRFNDSDLLANKSGILSINQKKRILNQGLLTLEIFAIFGIIFCGLFLIAAKKPIDEAVIEVSVILFVGFAIVGIAISWLSWKAYFQGSVKQLRGKVFFRQEGKYLCLCISDTAIPLLINISGFFEQDAFYNVYYVPIIRTIVAIEKIT
jgi:hypothetical protein